MNELMAAISLTSNLPAWTVMWIMAVGVFAGCKVMTWRAAGVRMSPARAVGYLCGWPGLDPAPFVSRVRHDCSTNRGAGGLTRLGVDEWAAAVGKTLLGITVVWGGVRLVPVEWPLMDAWVGIVGLGFLLHFGTFHLLALAWRAAGYGVRPLMDAPHRATSLADFWSRRWNLAFRDLSHRFILTPLRPRLGVTRAMLLVFLFSGLVHDLVISVPAGGGYGLPTLYFVLQALGLMAQRSRAARTLSLNRGVGGWVMTAAFVLGPLPLLFHEPFLTRIVLPFLAAIGAC